MMPIWSSKITECLLLVVWLKLQMFQRSANEEQQKQLTTHFSWIVEFPWVCRSRIQISEILFLFNYVVGFFFSFKWKRHMATFRIHALEPFSSSLDKTTFSLKEWNYELGERLWINTRWMLSLGFLLLCFFFFPNRNKSELRMTDWYMRINKPRIQGTVFRFLLWFFFFSFKKPNPQPLCPWVSHLPTVSSSFQVCWGCIHSGLQHV